MYQTDWKGTVTSIYVESIMIQYCCASKFQL